jgi:3-oxoacyl-[acyl-carrier protein] reductase
MMDLEGQAVVITGGAGDLARAIARILLRHGARVALLDRNGEGLAAARAELAQARGAGSRSERNGGTVVVAADLSREDEAERALSEAEAAMGAWTGLVNAVGVFQAVPLVELTVEDWDRLLAVNLRSTFICSREAVRRWSARRSGDIVSIASLAGQVGGIVAGANYAASKAGVISLTRSLAKQTAGLGIRVNCINPGVIYSRMTREDWPPGRLEGMVEQVPLRRLGTPDDVAGAVLFLLSDYSSYIHGAQIDVNGGLHVG